MPSDDDLQLGKTPPGFRSGFVTLVGRPNVGKSTLLNQMMREKVAITSSTPQTTRNALRGVFTTSDAQMVFVDTPGVHKPLSALGHKLNEVAWGSLGDVDVVVFVIDAHGGVGKGDAYVARQLQDRTTVVVLNKVDVVTAERLATVEAAARGLVGSEPPVLPVSARIGAGIPQLMHAVVDRLPPGPLYYPPDTVTDQPIELRVADLVREQVFANTRNEVPHDVAVVVDEIDPEPDVPRVSVTIYVARDSQKGIIIGRGGAMIAKIGAGARPQIEHLLGSQVFLDLRVRVERDWQRRSDMVERFGYGH